MMFNKFMHRFTKSSLIPTSRSYKNFGHKRQPIPGVTVLWHGFLTLTFIGLGIEWKRVAKFMLGDYYDSEKVEIAVDASDPAQLK